MQRDFFSNFFFQQLSRRHEQGSGTVPCEPDPHECSVLQALRQVSPQSSRVFKIIMSALRHVTPDKDYKIGQIICHRWSKQNYLDMLDPKVMISLK